MPPNGTDPVQSGPQQPGMDQPPLNGQPSNPGAVPVEPQSPPVPTGLPVQPVMPSSTPGVAPTQAPGMPFSGPMSVPPPAGPQAPMPPAGVPASTGFNNSYLDQAAASNNKNRLIGIAAIVFAVVILAAGGIGFALWSKAQNNPDQIFKTAINNLFSTKTVTQSTAEKDGSLDGSIAYDISNIKDPRMYLTASVKSSGMTIKFDTYGTTQNSYINFKSFGSDVADSYLSSIENKWVQMRTDNKLASGVDQDFADISNPSMLALGDLIFGNFSASQRKTLDNYVVANDVYKYDSKKVTTSTLNGRKVYVYAITENVDKLKGLNKKAAAYMGLSDSDIQPALDEIGANGTAAKLYVDAGSKRFVQATQTAGSQVTTNTYSKYNATTVPAEPSADMTWAQFQNKMIDLTGQSL